MTKTEIWNAHEIRFVEKEPGDWCALVKDSALTLGYKHTPHLTRKLEEET